MKNPNSNDTVFTVITGAEAELITPKPTEWIIEKIFPMGFKAIMQCKKACLSPMMRIVFLDLT